MPKDHPEKSWNVARGEAISMKFVADRAESFLPIESSLPRSLARCSLWTLDHLEQTVREKLLGRCRRPEDQYREIYNVFGRPKPYLTLRNFSQTIRSKLGVIVTAAEAQKLFNRYDANGDGCLDFQEFCQVTCT